MCTHAPKLTRKCSFPPPKIFTNALLSNHDITSLIRDTETHERALFSVPPPPPAAAQQAPAPAPEQPNPKSSSRRQTVFNVTAGEVTTGPPTSRAAGNPRRNTAVAAVLGGEMHATITRRAPQNANNNADVDIEVLLQGAEKLCHVYPLPGALERVPALRQRWAGQANTLAYYEAKVAGQTERLGRMNKRDDFGEEEEQEEEEDGYAAVTDSLMTEEDLKSEEEEVKELEKKRRELQERLKAMDKDLGGLLNM